MGARYINVDRDTPMLLPCDMKEWVESTDLVHFVVEALSEVQLPDPANARGVGSEQYPPGVFSSRKIERLTYQSVSVRYLCGNTHPDHDTTRPAARTHGPKE